MNRAELQPRRELPDGRGVLPERLGFICPGCGGDWHFVSLDRWSFNGSLESPTISPSVLTTVEFGDRPSRRCHLFVTDGEIRYLSDCTHSLAGQAIELPEITF